MEKETIIKANNLSCFYGENEVLKNISFEVKKGDFVALVGPNGAGKTTLVRAILGLVDKYSGEVELFGKKIKDFSSWYKIGFLPQRVNNFNPLFPAMVKEVVGLGLLSKKKGRKVFTKEDMKKIDETLSFLGILDLKDKSITELSGGQQQRVFLGRALVSNPELLILDEPSTALDSETRVSFLKLIQKLNKEMETSIIIITHDTVQTGEYASKLMFIDKEIKFFGGFMDFCHSDDMEKYFGHFAGHLICNHN
jgi:zinc transport system ATP-binding protein